MPAFKGFSSKTQTNIQIPPEFFTEVLPNISDTDELRLILFVFWYLQKRDENTGYVTLEELSQEPVISTIFSLDGKLSIGMLNSAVNGAVKDGILLRGEKEGVEYLFINSPRGAALQKGLESGEWIPGTGGTAVLPVGEPRPNIFTLYEQNIGLLTPLMAETLVDAEKIYPAEWIEEAVKIAVERNARNWRFVEAILRSWKEKGRNEKNQRTPAEGRKRDSEGEFSDFIRH
jgi:DnaD/phage-associated family protein